MIRVLIAEDSLVFQRVLISCLEKEKGIQVVGVVDNGLDAVEKCRRLRPDLVTMDILMPKMNGLDATRKIMAECPTRIVIISSMIDDTNLRYSFEAIQAGAVEVIDKPRDMSAGSYESVRDRLIRIVRQTMAAEPTKRFSWVVGTPWSAGNTAVPEKPAFTYRRPSTRAPKAAPSSRPLKIVGQLRSWEFENFVTNPDFVPNVICIGGSTGAPAVISDILMHLPGDFPLPILVAQHIVKGFVEGMSKWLDASSEVSVGIARENARLAPATVLFAPDDMHIGVSTRGYVSLEKRHKGDLYVPCVDRLFKTAAAAFGTRTMGILLSGMGKDGAEGLLRMREVGGVTIGQNRKTAVVYGMPKVANEIGGVMAEMSPDDIVKLLRDLSGRILGRSKSN